MTDQDRIDVLIRDHNYNKSTALLHHREDLLREVRLHLQDNLQKEKNRYRSIINILSGVV